MTRQPPPLIDTLLPQLEAIEAEHLRKSRETLGLTQAALAATLGLPVNTIARWERGELAIRHPEMLRLALAHLACSKRH